MKFVLFALAFLSRINIPRSCIMYLVFSSLLGIAASGRQKACSETAGSRSAYQGANWQVKLGFLIWKLRRTWKYPNKKAPCSLSADRNLWEQKGLQAALWEVKVADSTISSPCWQKKWAILLFLGQLMKNIPLHLSGELLYKLQNPVWALLLLRSLLWLLKLRWQLPHASGFPAPSFLLCQSCPHICFPCKAPRDENLYLTHGPDFTVYFKA